MEMAVLAASSTTLQTCSGLALDRYLRYLPTLAWQSPEPACGFRTATGREGGRLLVANPHELNVFAAGPERFENPVDGVAGQTTDHANIPITSPSTRRSATVMTLHCLCKPNAPSRTQRHEGMERKEDDLAQPGGQTASSRARANTSMTMSGSSTCWCGGMIEPVAVPAVMSSFSVSRICRRLQSELLHMEWSHADLARRTLSVVEQKNGAQDTPPLNATGDRRDRAPSGAPVHSYASRLFQPGQKEMGCEKPASGLLCCTSEGRDPRRALP
jgi:hypothetical protein